MWFYRYNPYFYKSKEGAIWMGIGGFVVALAFFFFGYLFSGMGLKDLVEVQATITEIAEVKTDDDRYEQVIYADYTDADGVFHQHVRLHFTTDTMREGDVITVAYEVAHPDVLVFGGSKVAGIVCALFGAVSIGSGIYSFISVGKRFTMKELHQQEIQEVLDKREA